MRHESIAVAGLFILAGGLLVMAGARGTRTYEDPRCRSCGRDLAHFGERPDECPRCARSLRRPRAVWFGRRRPRPRLVAIGLGVMVLGPIAGAIMDLVASR